MAYHLVYPRCGRTMQPFQSLGDRQLLSGGHISVPYNHSYLASRLRQSGRLTLIDFSV